jgi:hypothetical protein
MNDKIDSPILCRICNKPVQLTFDIAVDEDGQAVHEMCYVKKVRMATNQQPPEPGNRTKPR